MIVKSAAGVLGCAIAALLLFGALWLLALATIFAPANVREQWRFAYDYDEALGAIARNVCAIDVVIAGESDPKVKAIRQGQRLAYVTLYNTRSAEYDAAMRDAFRAGKVAPPDVPKQAPTLEQKEAEVCAA